MICRIPLWRLQEVWSPVETLLGGFCKGMNEKIKLSGWESFLMRIANYLRKNMEESEYKEHIFGLFFIERMSDLFNEKREWVKKDFQHLLEDALKAILCVIWYFSFESKNLLVYPLRLIVIRDNRNM